MKHAWLEKASILVVSHHNKHTTNMRVERPNISCNTLYYLYITPFDVPKKKQQGYNITLYLLLLLSYARNIIYTYACLWSVFYYHYYYYDYGFFCPDIFLESYNIIIAPSKSLPRGNIKRAELTAPKTRTHTHTQYNNM